MTAPPIYTLRGVRKVRTAPGAEFQLYVPEMNIVPGWKLALLGQSGCGKSTLLDMLAMTLAPTDSECFVFEPECGFSADISQAWRRGHQDMLARMRARYIGYVLQTGGLLPFLNVYDNIDLSCRLLGLPRDGAPERLAERLDLTRHLKKLPSTLSIGERQRVAIARALAHRPTVVLADEPTGSLDPITAGRVMELLVELADQLNVTLVVTSHDWNRVTALGLIEVHSELRRENGATWAEFQL